MNHSASAKVDKEPLLLLEDGLEDGLPNHSASAKAETEPLLLGLGLRLWLWLLGCGLLLCE